MAIESVTFHLGERRKVRVLVQNVRGKDCIVSRAQYILKCGDEGEDSGDCDIEQMTPSSSILSMLISPQRANATYTLLLRYSIGEEEYIYTCLVRVCLEVK